MPTTNNVTTGAKLIKLVDDLLYELESLKFGPETPSDIVQQYNKDVDDLRILLEKLVRKGIRDNTEEFKNLADQLTGVNQKLLKTLHDLAKISDTLKSLGEFIELLDEIARIASGITGTTLGAMKKAESSVEEKAPLFLIEEVLYGVELTKEKLIITVVSGGCTKEGDFRFDVNKGSEGQQQYTVTVYRIKPDDCKRVPELIQISYSREELGLDGHAVEFILRNKIGNTSQHRLDI